LPRRQLFKHGAFTECRIGEIRPTGWLRESLVRFADGLTGHLEAAGYPFDTVSWHGDESVNRCDFIWEPYEQTGYWVDGMLRCGMLLGDERLTARALQSIEHVLRNQREDGYLGPERMRTLTAERLRDTASLADYKRCWRWPHAVFFRSMMALPEKKRLNAARALRRHFLGDTGYDYTQGRDVLNVETALWAAEVTGDAALAAVAATWYEGFNRDGAGDHATLAFQLSDARDNQHGVTFNEMAKLGAVLYRYTGDVAQLRASENAYRKLDRDQMLVAGIPSSSEHLRGKDPLDSYETCDIADFIWSVGYLLMATGDARYADKLERALFNAGYGAVTPDAKALQYFGCGNQVICDRQSNHNEFFKGCAHMSYRPNPGTPCCPGNVNRIVPGFASRMWMRDGSGGIVAALYAPGRFEGEVGDGGDVVTIDQRAAYPFEDRVLFEFGAKQPVRFTFRVRIPGWCKRATLRVNGERVEGPLWPGSFVPLERSWRQGDVVELDLPSDARATRWPRDGVAIERGPLVFSLPVPESWARDEEDTRCTPDMPAWNIRPAGAWNLGLALPGDEPALPVAVRRPVGKDTYPWTVENAPIALEVDAYPLRGWDLARVGKVEREIGDGDGNEALARSERGCFVMTPQLPPVGARAGMLERPLRVRLVPYGCTQLRVTVFPDVSPFVSSSLGCAGSPQPQTIPIRDNTA